MSHPSSFPKNSQIITTLLLLWIGHFCVDFMLGIWSIYKTIAHLDLGKAGLIAGACALLGEGSQIFTGTLSDRGWRKHLLAAGIFSTTASMALAYTQQYHLLFLLYFCTCLGSGAFHPTAIGTLGSFKSPNASVLIAAFSAFGAMGMAFSQMIFSQAYFFLDGNTFWMAIPSLVIVALMIIHRFALNPPASSHAHPINFKGYLLFFKNRNLLLLFISQVCNQAVFWATIFLLPDALVSREYDSWLCYGGGHMIFVLGSASLMIPGGLLAQRYSSRSVIVAATATAITAYFTFFAVPLPPYAVIICLSVMGASMGMVNPISVALGIEIAPSHPSMVSAFLMGFVWCVSEGLGQTGGGLLATFFESDAPARALYTVSSLLFLGIACAYKLPALSRKNAPASMPLPLPE